MKARWWNEQIGEGLTKAGPLLEIHAFWVPLSSCSVADGKSESVTQSWNTWTLALWNQADKERPERQEQSTGAQGLCRRKQRCSIKEHQKAQKHTEPTSTERLKKNDISSKSAFLFQSHKFPPVLSWTSVCVYFTTALNAAHLSHNCLFIYCTVVKFVLYSNILLKMS